MCTLFAFLGFYNTSSYLPIKKIIQYIQEICELPSIRDNATKLHEDNAACITQIKGGFIKVDRTKHISPKCFYTHEL